MADPPIEPGELMDRSAAAGETAKLTALVLLATGNDIAEALALLRHFQLEHPPQEVNELDACGIAAQAIRDAVAMRGGVDA